MNGGAPSADTLKSVFTISPGPSAAMQNRSTDGTASNERSDLQVFVEGENMLTICMSRDKCGAPVTQPNGTVIQSTGTQIDIDTGKLTNRSKSITSRGNITIEQTGQCSSADLREKLVALGLVSASKNRVPASSTPIRQSVSQHKSSKVDGNENDGASGESRTNVSGNNGNAPDAAVGELLFFLQTPVEPLTEDQNGNSLCISNVARRAAKGWPINSADAERIIKAQHSRFLALCRSKGGRPIGPDEPWPGWNGRGQSLVEMRAIVEKAAQNPRNVMVTGL